MYYEGTPTPTDIVNAFIEAGIEFDIKSLGIDDPNIVETVNSIIPLNNLFSGDEDFSKTVYRNAIDVLKIVPTNYLKLIDSPDDVGKSIEIKNYNALKLSYKFYQKYRDPRIREKNIIQQEKIIESILNQAKLYDTDETHPIIPVQKILLPHNFKLNSIKDIPTLEWQRTDEDKDIFSYSLIITTFTQLRQGWMVIPDLVRLIVLADKQILKKIIQNLTVFEITQIISSLQRLADVLYMTNFGILDETMHFNIIESLFMDPLENRTNLPESDAKDIVDILLMLTSISTDFKKLAYHSRQIGTLTKPISNESDDFIGMGSSSDAIRQILSVIHYASNLEDNESQVRVMYEMINDTNFMDLAKYYFDPSYELLHTPFLSAFQATLERLQLYLVSYYYSDKKYSKDEISEIVDIWKSITKYLYKIDQSKQLLDIWNRINLFMGKQIKASIGEKPKNKVLDLIKGKEIILNIMTPLLLAKYENRGFNPLAAKVNDKLDSHQKSITGIIALASNFSVAQLENLLDTLFVEAPESKTEKSVTSNVPPNPSNKSSLPIPKATKINKREGSHLIPTPIGIGLTRIANKYVAGGGERNLHRALVDLISFTKKGTITEN